MSNGCTLCDETLPHIHTSGLSSTCSCVIVVREGVDVGVVVLVVAEFDGVLLPAVGRGRIGLVEGKSD